MKKISFATMDQFIPFSNKDSIFYEIVFRISKETEWERHTVKIIEDPSKERSYQDCHIGMVNYDILKFMQEVGIKPAYTKDIKSSKGTRTIFFFPLKNEYIFSY